MKKTTFSTVNGEIGIEDSGYILPHEHVVYFPVAQESSTFQETYDHFVPIYKTLVEQYNCKTIVELTPRLIANAPGTCRVPDGYRRTNFELYRDVCKASGMNLVLCTGFYREHTRPAYFFEKPDEELADEMIKDITEGIDDSRVKAGIIKVAIDSIESAGDRKLLSAAAIAQKATGVSITTHTCSYDVRFGLLNFLEGAGVDPSRIYLGHADTNSDIAESLSLAKRGCNLLLTIWGITNPALIGWFRGSLPKHHSSYIVKALIDEGYIDQTLVSVDYATSFIHGKFHADLYDIPDRNSCFAFTFIAPSLINAGISREETDWIMRENPRRMLL
jgi:phosphotriesterase-related protein